MSIVTLTTDFGEGDYACGLLHGVIWSISPEAEIVDLTHAIPRHNVLAGAIMLHRSMPYFPSGTVHVSVVDPGVGTARRPIAARLGDQYFVGPDNGLVSLAAKRCQEQNATIEFAKLDEPAYWLEHVSAIFHGRDVFAPAAAHLAQGIPLESMGTTIFDPLLLEKPAPIEVAGGYIAHVIHVDHFGNLSTDLHAGRLNNDRAVEIHAGEAAIHGISNTFGDKNAGELIAIIDSSGFLTICVVNGSAHSTLGLGLGSPISIRRAKS